MKRLTTPPPWALDVRTEMYALGISVRELAKAMESNETYLSSLLTGRRTSRFAERRIRWALQKLKEEIPPHQ